MWMMDHIMNNRLSLEFGQTFVFGNPPFGGSKFQSKAQRAQVRRIADLGGTGREPSTP